MGYAKRKPASEATRQHRIAKYARIRAEWFEANGPCQHCGSKERLECDHIDPELKVSHRIWSWGTDRRAAELAKCQVLCHECHRIKTFGERVGTLVHGTASGYETHRCRCDKCREWRNSYNRAWRALRKKHNEIDWAVNRLDALFSRAVEKQPISPGP